MVGLRLVCSKFQLLITGVYLLKESQKSWIHPSIHQSFLTIFNFVLYSGASPFSLSAFANTEKSQSTPCLPNLSQKFLAVDAPFLQQGLRTRQFSSLPLINAANIDSNNKKYSIASSFIKWISGIAVGSSLGLVYWYSTSVSDWSSAFFKKPFLSFAKGSTETAEFTVDGSINAFRKLALPDYSSKFIFGEVYGRKVFFNRSD